MLSVFPEFLNYGLLSPFLLRIALAIFIVFFGIIRFKRQKGAEVSNTAPQVAGLNFKKDSMLGIGEFVIGIFLAIGLLTQVAAILSLPILLVEWKERKNVSSRLGLEYSSFILAAAVALSLLFSGAGFFAFDLPL